MQTGEQFTIVSLLLDEAEGFAPVGEIMNDETFLNERIDVLAKFGTGLNPCVPIKFRRANGREVIVTDIGLRHPTTKGKRAVHVFDITDGSSDYRIELDSERLTWMLTRMGDAI